MFWIDIASIVFVCVTMNHLGLIDAVESVIKHKLPVINCPKCLTMWSVLAYGLYSFGFDKYITVLAISFLTSYIAIWLELFEAFIDTLFTKLYDKITATDYDDTFAADSFAGNTESTVSEL